ncbi:hypothetical protein D3C87_1300270 [compost metagenome]
MDVLDPHGLITFDQNSLHRRVSHDRQAIAFFRRAQIRHGSAAAAVVARGDLVEADAVLAFAIEIRSERNAGLLRSTHKPTGQFTHLLEIRDPQRTAGRVIAIVESLIVFGTLEVRQHLAKRPALATCTGPVVVILVLAADVDQRIHRTATAQHPTLGKYALASVHRRLRFGLVTRQ